MSIQYKIDALKRLAERPGTEHEGAVARAMLEKLIGENDKISRGFDSAFDAYRSYLRREISLSQFVEALRDQFPATCACGSRLSETGICDNWQRHLEIQTEIRTKFKKGDRVVYNMHAYPADCPGRVAAYVKLQPDNGSFPWAWLSIKFDCYRSARQVPVFDHDGWHLEHAVTEMVEV